MARLDPGIHPSSQEVFSKKMDCRVQPGNDDTVENRAQQIIHGITGLTFTVAIAISTPPGTSGLSALALESGT
jgi:hypothetical protein